MSAVGTRVREKRKSLGLTQEKLASAAGISKGFLSDIETGERNLSAESLLKLSGALGVSLDFLMKGDSGESSGDEHKQIQFPQSLADLAKKRGLGFDVALTLLEMKLQVVAHRSDTKDDNLDSFDWEGFYDSVKDYI